MISSVSLIGSWVWVAITTSSRDYGWREEGLEVMRYQVRFPLESGNRLKVFDLGDRFFPDQRKVLTLLPAAEIPEEIPGWVKKIESRINLHHPALPPVLDIAYRGKQPGLVTKRIDAPSLESLAGKIHYQNAQHIALVLSDLLLQLHRRNIFLGYINPRKIFITRDKHPVLNFLLPEIGNVPGSKTDYAVRYAAPEFLKTKEPSSAADCYSLGIILFILLTGTCPVLTGERNHGDSEIPTPLSPWIASNSNPLVSPRISSIISSLMNPLPEKRPGILRIIQELRTSIPEFKAVPITFKTGIIGREDEIARFNSVLKKPDRPVNIFLIEGNPGVGKSRLSAYFQLAARLHGFELQHLTDKGKISCPRSSATSKHKLLFCLQAHELAKPPGLPSDQMTGRDEAIIIIEGPGLRENQFLKDLERDFKRLGQIHHIHLDPLNKRKSELLVESLLGDKSSYSYFQKISNVFPGNPYYVELLLKAIHESGELHWEDGNWNWLPGKHSLTEIPDNIRTEITKLFNSLSPIHKKVLAILAVCQGMLSLDRMTEVLEYPETSLPETIHNLENLGLIQLKGDITSPIVMISHPWISGITEQKIPEKEKENLHWRIGGILEGSPGFREDLPTVCEVCRHYLKSGHRKKAGKYLPLSMTYLTKNSSFHKALDLFDTAVETGMISTSIPENWLINIKLLLKTGREKKCRDFMKKSPGFRLNNTILFRLGCILDSLDLEAEDICPHLSVPLKDIFSQASCMAELRTSSAKKSSFTGTFHPIKNRSQSNSPAVIQGKVRYCHHFYKMHLEQGKPGRAFNHEIKAFRSTLSLAKKSAASRRLLNLASVYLSEDRIKQPKSWLRYCIQMAEETGDIRTLLEAKIHLTVPDRKAGYNQRASFDLSRIGRFNDFHCGSRSITSKVLLEEAKNLAYQARFTEAMEKISALRIISLDSEDKHIHAEILLIEAYIWAARRFHVKALTFLDRFNALPGEKQPSHVVREQLLRSRIYLDQGTADEARISINKLISKKAFLSPYKLAKTRIVQSELYLAQNEHTKAAACINDALRISRKNSFIPLISESYLQKAKCLILRDKNREALPYCTRASSLSDKIDRPDLKLKMELISKLADKSTASMPPAKTEATATEAIGSPSEKDGRLLPDKGSIRLGNGKVIIGTTSEMKNLLNRLARVADSDTTVLLQGESGTGKELMARALHEHSSRRSGSFIPVNCSTLPADLVENELFGHMRGSYTGADSTSKGLFESASGGTIFLDEISTLPLEIQPRLLRVLADKKIRPLGSSSEKNIDVRVVAATNQDLWDLVTKQLFRKDLYFRLNAVRIEIPPLRKRKQDIAGICGDYIEKHQNKNNRKLSEKAVEALREYEYPGNVRELLNILENLLCFSPSKTITRDDVMRFTPVLQQLSSEIIQGTESGEILKRFSTGKTNFWDGVRQPFISRDINRGEVRDIVSAGLKKCGGSYKDLLGIFNLKPAEYKKFLSFLEHHDCKVDFREFRPTNKG